MKQHERQAAPDLPNGTIPSGYLQIGCAVIGGGLNIENLIKEEEKLGNVCVKYENAVLICGINKKAMNKRR